MLTVALTGGIGCGKTTVCNIFSELGAPIIDTDTIAHELVEIGSPALLEITEYFGQSILNNNGSLNRKKLATLIFNDAQRKDKLESILHPRIRQNIKKQLSKLDSIYVIIAIPLLFETSQQKKYERILVVDCEPQQQIKRTQDRDHRTLQQIEMIIDKQVDRNYRLKNTHDIIDNTNNPDSLRQQIIILDQTYRELAQHKHISTY